jgi:GMP synthase-like glutamine amidotransferase
MLNRITQALHQTHQDEVYECPPGAELLAYTDSCPVQAMYIPKTVLTVQGHPEFTEEIMRDLLDAKHAQEIFTKEIFEDTLKRVHKDHDGVVVAQAFLRFLLEE